MEIVQKDYQHFIKAADLQREMEIMDVEFKSHIRQHQWVHKKLTFTDINGQRFISCKSTVRFLDWYLQGIRLNPNLNNFKHAMVKYSKKIPKRTLSRSLRIEIAYRQSYKCNKCELFPIPPNFEVDHIIELHDGGEDIAENLQALCPACHKLKTRLNRLRKNKIFQAVVQNDYESFIPTTEPKEQVFSKYFRKRQRLE
jgi:hypothetical protein